VKYTLAQPEHFVHSAEMMVAGRAAEELDHACLRSLVSTEDWQMR
jgi:hypothetical protein